MNVLRVQNSTRIRASPPVLVAKAKGKRVICLYLWFFCQPHRVGVIGKWMCSRHVKMGHFYWSINDQSIGCSLCGWFIVAISFAIAMEPSHSTPAAQRLLKRDKSLSPDDWDSEDEEALVIALEDDPPAPRIQHGGSRPGKKPNLARDRQAGRLACQGYHNILIFYA
jgi:hypothetical protein